MFTDLNSSASSFFSLDKISFNRELHSSLRCFITTTIKNHSKYPKHEWYLIFIIFTISVSYVNLRDNVSWNIMESALIKVRNMTTSLLKIMSSSSYLG